MAKTIDRKLAEQLRAESERTKDEPYPVGATYTRPNRDRSRVYSVRLSESEYEQELRRKLDERDNADNEERDEETC